MCRMAAVCLLCAGISPTAASDMQEVDLSDGMGAAVMPDRSPQTSPVPVVPQNATIRLRLPPLSSDERREQLRIQSGDGPLRLGFGRTLADFAAAQDAAQAAFWHETHGGRHLLAWQVRSPGAVGLRLALSARHLPDDTRFWVSGPDQPAGPPMSGADINAGIRRNLNSNSAEDTARLIWLPLVVGDTLLLTAEFPAGVRPQGTAVQPVHIAHLFRLPFLAESRDVLALSDDATGPRCAKDWGAPSRATTLLLYTHPDGATGACTGTLLNDADPDTYIPYVLSAQHCFPDQVRASSIESLWFARSETCGGDPSTYATVSGGADVLYLAQSTDTALLRLRRPPPAGAVFAGWKPVLPGIGTETVGVHHPLAGAQHRSTATVGEYKTCVEVDWCGDNADPQAIGYIKVDRWIGGTKPGSSGSGLYNAAGQLIGTNLGGSDAEHFDYYGRFDAPYRDALHRWLGHKK